MYLDITTGWIMLWLWIAILNAPFLNGSNWSPWCRVPSGQNSNLYFLSIMLFVSLFNWLWAFFAFDRSRNNVSHIYDAGPNGNKYRISFLTTVEHGPTIGHKWAITISWKKKRKRKRNLKRKENVSLHVIRLNSLITFCQEIKLIYFTTQFDCYRNYLPGQYSFGDLLVLLHLCSYRYFRFPLFQMLLQADYIQIDITKLAAFHNIIPNASIKV